MKAKSIWKFPLKLEGGQNISMPKGAQILCAQTQNEQPYLWALCDPEEKTEGRHIEIFGTGHPVGYDAGVERKYISTFQMKGGLLVYHAFEYTGV